jgi:hypothetical protein
MWQRDLDANGDGKVDGNDGLDWCAALDYCEGLKLGGHDDWRLPNLRELQSILDYGRYPAIDPILGRVSGWSSNSWPFHPDEGRFVFNATGELDAGGKVGPTFIRAVRNGW